MKSYSKHYFLMPGAHVVMVAGGNKTLRAITTMIMVATCRMFNLKHICACTEENAALLARSLSEKEMTTFDPSAPRLTLDTLRCLTEKSRENSAALLIDIGMKRGDELSPLVEEMGLRRLETLTLVLPVHREVDLSACARVINHCKPEHVMIHAYDMGYRNFRHDKSIGMFLERFPIWMSEKPTSRMINVIRRSGKFSYLPAIPELDNYRSDFSQYIEASHRREILNVLRYVVAGARTTDKHVFGHIACQLF